MNKWLLPSMMLLCPLLRAQDDTFLVFVRSYQWTTTHKTLSFSWPGSARTSCSGDSNISGSISSQGYINASGTSSSTCTTTYTPPTNQTIDIQKPVLFVLAETETSRMMLTCTRNTAWSQCKAPAPGGFRARDAKGHLEVKSFSAKGKEEWIKFNIVRQTAILTRPTVELTAAQQAPAPPTIEAPKSDSPNDNGGFPTHWKSMSSSSLWTLRFEGEYLYAERVEAEAYARAGAFMLVEAKRDGDKYNGDENGRVISSDRKACSMTIPFEFTMVTPQRIEGRAFAAPPNARIDWSTCTYSATAEWQPFVWIPVQ